jgi:hypothetical protein
MSKMARMNLVIFDEYSHFPIRSGITVNSYRERKGIFSKKIQDEEYENRDI